MPTYQDANKEGHAAYKIEAIPTTVIIDKAGKPVRLLRWTARR